MPPLSVPTLASRGSLKASGLLAFSFVVREFTARAFQIL